MRVLFDPGTPAPLRRHLVEHSVDTTFEMFWSNLRNGDLLDRGEEGNYDLFITTDQQLLHQQNFTTRQLAVPCPAIYFMAAHPTQSLRDPGCHQSDATRRVPRDIYLISIPIHKHTNW